MAHGVHHQIQLSEIIFIFSALVSVYNARFVVCSIQRKMDPNLSATDDKQCGILGPPTLAHGLSTGCGGVVTPGKCPVKCFLMCFCTF